MLIVAIVCMAVAVVALGVGLCFVKTNKVLFPLLSSFLLISLVCLGICATAYKNNFSGFAILLIVSICPLFAIVNLPQKNEEDIKEDEKNDKALEPAKNLNATNKNVSELNSVESLETSKNAINNIKKSAKNANFQAFMPVLTEFLRGIAYFLSALAITFCGLFIGKESWIVFALGFSIGLTLTFLDFIIKKDDKEKNIKTLLFTYLQKILIFTSVGLLLGALLLPLLYSFSTSNILFAIGCLAYAFHILLQKYFKSSFNHLPYILAMLLLFASILF